MPGTPRVTPAPPPAPPVAPPAATSSAPRPALEPAAGEEVFARRVLQAEAASVGRLAETLGPAFGQAVGLIVRCADSGGNVLVSGLGKSGLIGQKIAATLSSVGIPSHFVHPAEAAHGDLGRFRATDVCIALSYSGETAEVVSLAAILRQDNLPVIAITRGSDGGSALTLERLAAVSLAIGACDDPAISPAPTCSTTCTLALGDALALCAARRRNFTDDDFRKRHPGGALGGLLQTVGEVLRFRVGRNLAAAPDDLSMREAMLASDLPGVRRPGALLLVDRSTGVLSGIFTDGDLRRVVLRSHAELDRPARELMTRAPQTIRDAALVRDAVNLVREHRRDEIPVVDAAGRPVGILDVQDLISMRLIEAE
ncbi:MAG: KpsF/GutQ family sugar-phosphate isomerase [Phycisphaeraceae bacterium]|nr:KpsF/GutQ family sugar-phosphate isomerase [Phycisphaeraceae bacterium]